MLAHRVVLITGASRGIGAATSRLLAAHGAAVVVNYKENEFAAREVVEKIESAGGRALAMKADVRDEAAVREMVREAGRILGPIDTLVNNASIGFPIKPFSDYSWAEFESKLSGELKAAFNCCKAVLPSMRERRAGCIIAVSSTLSRRPGPGFAAHSAAKSGLDGLMRALALELGPLGIRVNVVAPGLTETDATARLPGPVKVATAQTVPLGRLGQPLDVAGAVLMLASDSLGFVSGAYLAVNGGAFMA